MTMTKFQEPPVSNDDTVLLEASQEYGLWISWTGDGSAVMEFVKDESQTDLHPHIHTPPLQHTQLVKGGGSGATVFSGDLGEDKLVWKHGDYKDMRDVFALAEIEHELLLRSEFAKSSADNLLSRIPRFAGVFISPAAFRVRPDELWNSLRKTIIKWNSARNDGHPEEELAFDNGLPRPASHQDLAGCERRRIKVLEGEADIDVLRREVRFYVETCAKVEGQKVYCDYDHTKELVYLLVRLQAKHVWKFSVAQVSIGGETPKTGASLLTSGKLRGDLLNDLLDQFMNVLRSLQAVTKPEEKEAVDKVREEAENMPDDMSPADVSNLADSFVGSAIVKNWHPEKGRYKVARELAIGLRGEDDSLVLTEKEVLPARAIGNLLSTIRASMNTVFIGAQEEFETPFYRLHGIWRDLLMQATHLKSKTATECIWTCGLTDAGLHNMFFSDGQLWLFDLGKPNYQPLPAFLTKFLMSFFHALGMEDTPDGSTWVNRFQEPQAQGSMLELTAQTKELLPIAHEAYSIALDRLINEMFDGEEAVRGLLVKYTILQILSDASFCVQKWQIKGGGAPTYGEGNHNRGLLEKWLWRALWDIYVAADVMRTYDIYVSSEIMKTCEPYVSSSDLSSMGSN